VKPIAVLTLWPLWTGVAMTLISNLLAFTPVVWYLSGSPSESYPELFFLGFFIPVSLLVLLVGAIHAWVVVQRRNPMRPNAKLRG
jgi:hypothetical protein